jgi:hypothetical protein
MSGRHTLIASRLNLGAVRLRDATESRDWMALAREERELRTLAGKLAAHAHWQAAEYRALDDVRTEMRAALVVIAQEKQRVAEEIEKFNRYRAAWVAYGMYDDAQGALS